MNDGILTGLRIVDMTQGPAGVATLLLAEAGADVIKVEPPNGDRARGSAGFSTWSRSKRSIVLDVDDDDDRAILHQLIASTDVFVHEERPVRAAKLGIDDSSLSERHPRLVISALTRTMDGHEDADRYPDPMLVEAKLGLMGVQPGYRPGPVFLRYPLATYGTVYLLAAGILARLIDRERRGIGGVAHTSWLQGGLSQIMMRWSRISAPNPTFDHKSRPTIFQAGDGKWMHLMSSIDASPLMARALERLGPEKVAELDADPDPDGEPPRRLPKSITAAFRLYPLADWLEDFWAHDIAVQECATPGTIFDDEQARLNGYIVEVNDPVFGHTRQAGNGLHVSPATRVVRPAPLLDEHRRELLAELSDGSATADRPAAAPHPGADPAARYPLEGVRVLDFGQFLAGPYGAMLLADLGADVIKIENVVGDPMRAIEQVFLGCQRGKRGLALDLKSPDAAGILRQLVESADIVHHNIRMPAARRLGLDYPTLQAIKADVVLAHVSNYGPRGPQADWPGFDQLGQAASGWEVAGAGEGNPPAWYVFGMMDYLGALQSLIGVLLALFHRYRTGIGQDVRASILGGAALTMSEVLQREDGSLTEFKPLDKEQTGISPGYRIYRASDAWIALCATTDDLLQVACTALGVENASAIELAISTQTSADVLACLEAAGVPVDRVEENGAQALFESVQAAELGLTASYSHPVYGQLDQIGRLWSFGDLEVKIDRPVPLLGQHSREILEELGLNADRIGALLVQGVVVDASSDA